MSDDLHGAPAWRDDEGVWHPMFKASDLDTPEMREAVGSVLWRRAGQAPPHVAEAVLAAIRAELTKET